MLNLLFEYIKIMAQLQTCKDMAIYLNWTAG